MSEHPKVLLSRLDGHSASIGLAGSDAEVFLDTYYQDEGKALTVYLHNEKNGEDENPLVLHLIEGVWKLQ